MDADEDAVFRTFLGTDFVDAMHSLIDRDVAGFWDDWDDFVSTMGKTLLKHSDLFAVPCKFVKATIGRTFTCRLNAVAIVKQDGQPRLVLNERLSERKRSCKDATSEQVEIIFHTFFFFKEQHMI